MSRTVNALVGAAVTVVLVSFVPFSPIVGGAVAGYLNKDDGVTVGTISGLFALLPVLLVAFMIGLVAFAFVPVAPLASGLALVGMFIAIMFLLAYVVALSSVGGYLGVYIYQETSDS